jgi:Phasin protein
VTEARSNPILPNFMSPDVAGIGKKQFETLAAVQKEFLGALNKANQAWIDCFNEDAALTSNFIKKVTTAGSIPEAAAAYQEWARQQMELFSRQARKIFEETQDFNKAWSQIVGNGKGTAGS